MNEIERIYNERVQQMSAVERVRRAESAFGWSQDFLARSIRHELPELSPIEFKWELAKRQYGSDANFLRLLEECRGR